MEWFLDSGIRILVIIAVAIVLHFVLKAFISSVIKKLIIHGMSGELESAIEKRSNTLTSILNKLADAVIVIAAILTILPEFGVNIATLLAGIGVGGLAIAFAAQNLVRDFITGFFIILEDQYRVGDVVTIAGISGTVEEIGLRRTLVRDVTASLHSIPNGRVEISTNMTKKFSRISFNISVGYGENLKVVMDKINEVCAELAEDDAWKDDFLTTPSAIRVDNLGDSGIDIRIMGDTKPGRQWAITGELKLRLKNAFDEAGIEIPWPHTKIYFGNSSSGISKN
ncbi:MAG: mechanosensitive ion channel family protein [Dehalococcoidales bacterium]|nr:mechanosensitive ion channel family protein [Dehalococcoidales bacterium]